MWGHLGIDLGSGYVRLGATGNKVANAAEVCQKWLRLSEQLSPILRWTPCGLPRVQ